jgi:hypothetical protein
MKKLNTTSRLVFRMFQDIAQETGSNKITPTNKQMSAKIELGPREISRCVKILIDNGLIKMDYDPNRQPARILEILEPTEELAV